MVGLFKSYSDSGLELADVGAVWASRFQVVHRDFAIVHEDDHAVARLAFLNGSIDFIVPMTPWPSPLKMTIWPSD